MDDIIKKFDENTDLFAESAVLEAQRNKGKINKTLLKHLEDYLKEMDKGKPEEVPMSIIYSIFLLAEFKDKSLFDLIVKIVEHPAYDCDKIFGDSIGQLSSIIVSVFDKDFDSLNRVIENPKIDEWTRRAFLKTYIFFYDHGILSQEEVKKYLLKLIELYDYNDDPIYDTILEVIINTHQFSMIKDVQKMFRNNVIDTMIRGEYENFIDYIFDYDDDLDKFSEIDNTVDEMCWWYCFENNRKPDKKLTPKKVDKMLKEIMEKEEGKLNTTGKVGRNDPCPCGSGKKYKKCCLDKEEKLPVLSYQKHIEESLSKYPKRKSNQDQIDIYDIYREDAIELDKKMYRILTKKHIPLFIERNITLENQIDISNSKKVLNDIEEIVKKEKFKTLEDFDDKISVHFSIYQFIEHYTYMLLSEIDNPFSKNHQEYKKQLEYVLDYFYKNLDLKGPNEILFIDRKKDLLDYTGRSDEAIEFLEEKLKDVDSSIKYDIYEYLFSFYMRRDEYEKMDTAIKNEKDQKLKKQLKELHKHLLEHYN